MVCALKSMLCMLCVCGFFLGGCAAESPHYRNQRAFASPASAVNALAAAAKNDDMTALEGIFGAEGREVLSSGDPVSDRRNREVFTIALEEEWSLENVDGKTREIIVGHEQWPFPIPLVKDRRGWWFDTVAGKQEILARRIGRNELAAIGVCRTYVISQREYAREGHDGNPSGMYAQKIRSATGEHDGLYWPTSSPGEKPSPLGELAAQAAAEGYTAEHEEGRTPYLGYFYRILTRQGPDAPGGAKQYIVNGKMTEGFALVAYPAEYGNSGIMTFLVNQDGIVYEADLGPDTWHTAGNMEEYNPDSGWQAVDSFLGTQRATHSPVVRMF